jgi:hypothetical protein
MKTGKISTIRRLKKDIEEICRDWLLTNTKRGDSWYVKVAIASAYRLAITIKFYEGSPEATTEFQLNTQHLMKISELALIDTVSRTLTKNMQSYRKDS